MTFYKGWQFYDFFQQTYSAVYSKVIVLCCITICGLSESCCRYMDEPNIPDWLTPEFLKACLESDSENFPKIAIISHLVESAVKKGYNYKSEMLRVKIQYTRSDNKKEHSISLIVKAPLTEGVMETFKDVAEVMYTREPKYYNEFINTTHELSNHNIVPKPYTCVVPRCVVMEDLTASGYKMVDRHNLLDFNHCQLYVKASAKLHALSIAVNKKNPELIQSLVKESPGMTKAMYVIFKTLIFKSLRCMAAYLEGKPNCKEYLSLFTRFTENDNFLKTFIEMMSKERYLKAVTQEDPWCANMMFKYNDSGEVASVKIFDFQRLKFTTPVLELVTFVWGSMHPDTRKTKLDDIYHLYCDSLNKNLADLGCSERLSFEEMKLEIASLNPMAVFVSCSMLPIYIADGVADVNDYLTGEMSDAPIKQSKLYKLYEGSYFNKYFPQVLDQLAAEGVFDYLKEKIR